MPRFMRTILAAREDAGRKIEREVAASLYPRHRLGIMPAPVASPVKGERDA